MRDLARRHVSVCCIDCDSKGSGFRTIYGRGYVCPNPDNDPAAWLKFMIELARKTQRPPVLIPAADQFVSAIADHADKLSDVFLFCHKAIATQALLATKERQYDVAIKHGMPVSRTRFVKDVDDLLQFASTADSPYLLKPVHARHWECAPANHPLQGARVVLAESVNDLIAKYKLAAQINPQLVVQEVIQGPDTAKLVYLSCYGNDGRRLGACLVRELRTFPMHFGSASVVEPLLDPEVDAICDRFLRSLTYAGICEIELKRDSRDGQVKMIEANPRYSVTADAAPYAGVPLGWLHYLDLIGYSTAPVTPHERNFRHIVLRRDFPTVGNYIRAGLLSWRSLLLSYRPPVAFYDFNIWDWRNSAATLRFLARVVVGRIARRILRLRR